MSDLLSIKWSGEQISIFPILKISATILSTRRLTIPELLLIAFSIIDKVEIFNGKLIEPNADDLKDSKEDIFFFVIFKTKDDLNSFINYASQY